MSDTQTRPSTPAEAWAELQAGNKRFVEGAPEHPNQGAERRGAVAGGQAPFATIFGCGDSRVASEVIFDQGLGDLFVVRTAGHVVDGAVLGSLEFGAAVLNVPLLVILGHDSCGAVKASIAHYSGGAMPGGYIRDIVERVTPSVVAAMGSGAVSPDEVEAEHVRQTMTLLKERSSILSSRIEAGQLAIVGLTYALAEGGVTLVDSIGDIG